MNSSKISQMFDYKFEGQVIEKIPIPIFPKDFGIGLIVGSSGSGKSTILRHCFGNVEDVHWDLTKSIASNFDSFEEASEKFGAVGLNSIPTWCKPYNVLSNGEKFRADIARRLKDDAVIDEFTSVVNREVAVSCSVSIEKYIRKYEIKNVVFASCHDDIVPYLNPDWIYNTDEHEFYTGRYLRQPIILETHSCDSSLWDMFAKYHYLSGKINKAGRCYVGLINNRPVVFASVLTLPGKIKHAFKEHRLVVHPDFQGMGIGNKFSEMIGQSYVDRGARYFCKTANPRIGVHRDNSELWRPTSHNHKKRKDYIGKDGNVNKAMHKRKRLSNDDMIKFHAQRLCYAHEYIGDGTTYPYTMDMSKK